MIILIRFFLYCLVALSSFLLFFGVKYQFHYLTSIESHLRHENLAAAMILLTYSVLPTLLAFCIEYYFKNPLHKIEIKLSKIPLIILVLSFLTLSIIMV